jgi:predicted ATPase/DNA-binding SARP family transcriptional activator
MKIKRAKEKEKLKIYLFGMFQVWRNGKRIEPEVWKRRKTLSLLKVLLTQPRGHVFTQDQLIEALYPGASPSEIAGNLYGRISELRKVLEPHIKKGNDSRYLLRIGVQGYVFNKETECWIDTDVFDTHLRLAREAERTEQWRRAIEHYHEAIALYRGDFLSEDIYAEWSHAARQRWHDAYLSALSGMAEAHARLGQYLQALDICRRLLERSPTHEEAYRQKMLYHYLNGEIQDAFRTYESCEVTLKHQLDLTPSTKIQKLYQELLQGGVKYIEGIYPEPNTAFKHNLPVSLTRFIGRELEITEIKALLKTNRLVTLTGPGGGGKTRLALEIANQLSTEIRPLLVELASVSCSDQIERAVALALKLIDESEKHNEALMSASFASLTVRQKIIDAIRPSAWLLVLDNCEHLVAGVARWVTDVAQQCPKLRVLATSREALNIAGETVWQVLPLAYPDEAEPSEKKNALSLNELKKYDSVSLFVDRAKLRQKAFSLTSQNAPWVAQICRRLEGIPLAIELATAQLKALNVSELAERLNDRFSLTMKGPRSASARHETLQGAIGWSYRLLSEKERALLCRFSVFQGSFTLQAAEAICVGRALDSQEIFTILSQLVDKSLVYFRPEDEPTRYQMLQTVCEYSQARWLELEPDEQRLLKKRFLSFFEVLAHQTQTEPDQLISYEKSLKYRDEEQRNFCTAFRWAWEEDPIKGLYMAVALSDYWLRRGQWKEGEATLAYGLAHAEDIPNELKKKALAWSALLAYAQGDHPYAQELIDRRFEINDDFPNAKEEIFSHNVAGLIAFAQQDYPTAHRHHQWALKLSREIQDKRLMTESLTHMAALYRHQGNFLSVKALLTESLRTYRELGCSVGAAQMISSLGVIARDMGEYSEARAQHRESLKLHRELGDRFGTALALKNLGDVACFEKKYEEASDYYSQSLRAWQETDGLLGMIYCIEGLAMVAAGEGQAEQCVRLFGAAQRWRQRLKAPTHAIDRANYERHLEKASAELSEAEYKRFWAEGQNLSLAEAMKWALRRDCLASYGCTVLT